MSEKLSPHILLVEDETAIAETIIYALKREGFSVVHHQLGHSALAALKSTACDLVILDVGLPDINGFDVCRDIRSFSEVPVIFLTARNEEIDRILGLELGADDYVSKPFSPRELIARVRARLRRTPSSTSQTLESTNQRTVGPFCIDKQTYRIEYHQQLLDLTRYEYGLLDALLRHPGAIYSRAQLMDYGWDHDADSTDRTVDTHIKTLRAKLRAIEPDQDPIKTHRGLGYSIMV